MKAECIVAVSALDRNDGSPSGGAGTSLTISDCGEILQDARCGDSISINGITLCRLGHSSNPPIFGIPVFPHDVVFDDIFRPGIILTDS